ncbi:MAG: DUF3631 domain-containing protein [Sulfuriferula sp.]|nr:DUF3631 domain-containing protein [Sulfuriferula sp.]
MMNNTESTKKTDDETIAWLSSLSVIAYDRVRARTAKDMGIRPAILDALVNQQRGNKGLDALPFPEHEPCNEPINPADLLDEVKATIKRFIILDDEQATVSALWCAMTWFIEHIDIAPLCLINAPEKACGKSELLKTIKGMSCRPLLTENATTSALFRAVELWKPTLLIDESDTFFKEKPEMTGVVNAGYERSGGVLRSEPDSSGKSYIPKLFPVYSAKAIAGIMLEKHLADATLSRGVMIRMRKRMSFEHSDELSTAEDGLFDGISSRLARFAEDYGERVRYESKKRIDGGKLISVLSDRENKHYRPLLAIASMAGDKWQSMATNAAIILCASVDKSISTGNELLNDIRDVFERLKVDKIKLVELVTALCEDEENAWATYNYGKALSTRQLSKLLGAYGISSKTYRYDYETAKGYERAQFDEVFKRYLAYFESGKAECYQNSSNTQILVTSSVTLEANNGVACEADDENVTEVTEKNTYRKISTNYQEVI